MRFYPQQTRVLNATVCDLGKRISSSFSCIVFLNLWKLFRNFGSHRGKAASLSMTAARHGRKIGLSPRGA
jgi:hypothetical protein